MFIVNPTKATPATIKSDNSPPATSHVENSGGKSMNEKRKAEIGILRALSLLWVVLSTSPHLDNSAELASCLVESLSRHPIPRRAPCSPLWQHSAVLH